MVLQHEELVGPPGSAAVHLEAPFLEEGIHLLRRHVHHACARVELMVIDLVVVEILGGDAEDVGLDAQVQVLRHQEDPSDKLLAQAVGHGEDPVVRLLRVEAGREIAHGVLVVELDAQPPARGKRHACRQTTRLAHPVELLGNDTGVAPDFVLPFLLVVDFLDDGHGDDHLVVFEGKEGPRVVKQHVRVQYVCFYHGLRLLCFRACPQHRWALGTA